MSLLQSVFESPSVRSTLITGPAQCGKTSCGFSMAYEEAKNGGVPLFFCHKSHFEAFTDDASPNLPIPVRIGHAPLHKTLFRADILERINIKYFSSWQDLLSLLITIQHATISFKYSSSSASTSSSNAKQLELQPSIPFTMLVIDDIHLVLPPSSNTSTALTTNKQHSSFTPISSNMTQLLLLIGLVHDTIQFQQSLVKRNPFVHYLKAIVILDTQIFSSHNTPQQAIPTGIQRSFDVCVSFVPDGMHSYRVFTGKKQWNDATGDMSSSRHITLLAQKTVLLVPRESENKILVFLPSVTRAIGENESQDRNDSMVDTNNSGFMDGNNTF